MARLIIATGLDQHVRRYPRLQKILFALESSVMHLLWWGFGALSVERASRVGAAIVRWVGPRTRKGPWVIGNLGLAFPDKDPQQLRALARATWSNVGAVAGEYAHLERIALDNGGERLEVVDHVGLEAYARRERHAVFFGAHLSNWEINGLALGRAGVPVWCLYAPIQNPHIDRLMCRAREQLGCTLVPRDGSMRPVIAHLRNGGSLGLLADLRVADGVPLPFFGHDMETSLVPARLALRHACDLIPIRTARLRPGWFRFTIDEPLEIPESGTEEQRATLLAREMNRRIEASIRESPGEWLCTNRRWAKGLYPHKRATGHALD